MTNRLTTVLRRPEGLFGILSVRQASFERPTPPEDADEAPALTFPTGGPYVEETRPLADVPETLVHRRNLLLRSWEALRAVETLNAEVLANVLHVLIGTVPDPAADTTDVPDLVMDEPPPAARPTAAHPRAYRGTKYKPPKLPRPGPIDLRSHLCVAADEDRLLTRLSPYLDEAVTRVAREHPYGEVLRSRGPEALRPYGQCWATECRKQIAALPATFRRHLLWNLQACDWEHVAAALSAYWALGLERNVPLRRCVSTLLSIHPMRQMVDWCHVTARMPQHRQVHFAELLIESSAYWTRPDEEVMSGLIRADALSSDAVYRHRMFYALSNVKEKCGLNYANDGFLLANEWRENHEFDKVASLEGVATAVKTFAAYAHDAEDWWPTSALTLWERCADLEGFKELPESLDWRRLDPQSACRLVHILVNVVYDELDEGDLRRKWCFLHEQADRLLRFIEQVDIAYRPKALDGLGELVWIWDDPEKLGAVLGPFLRLLMRTCASPFRKRGFGHYALTAFTTLPSDEWRVIEQANDASFHKLEVATARQNDAWLIGRGLWSMCESSPRLTAAGFDRFPQQVLKAAQTLGVPDEPVRRDLIKSFARHPLTSVDETALGTQELVALVEEHLRSGVANPIPRRMKEHLRGERTLRPTQVERDVALIRAGWLALQLDVLNQVAFDRMSQGLPTAGRTGKVKHALMLQQLAKEHRRSLRRLLKAYLSGRRGYAEDHPKNREWLARHPQLDPSKWTQGLRHRGEVRGHGVLDLSIERDALEVLRLGSYFGTCLGLGGGLSYSAAAITLDVNKQVVYARSAAGRVVARQLLAVSEDDRLICFAVYPKRIGKDVRALFREFDLRFAAYLGVAVYEPSEEDDADEYEIASVVSREFWDDDAWDLNVTGD